MKKKLIYRSEKELKKAWRKKDVWVRYGKNQRTDYLPIDKKHIFDYFDFNLEVFQDTSISDDTLHLDIIKNTNRK